MTAPDLAGPDLGGAWWHTATPPRTDRRAARPGLPRWHAYTGPTGAMHVTIDGRDVTPTLGSVRIEADAYPLSYAEPVSAVLHVTAIAVDMRGPR